jgi:3-phosphoshikimate 1-carboxyvinyltransferase
MHVETRHDHRIAMAFSTLKPWIQELTFSDSDCVEKSFPNYWEQWKKCTFE